MIKSKSKLLRSISAPTKCVCPEKFFFQNQRVTKSLKVEVAKTAVAETAEDHITGIEIK